MGFGLGVRFLDGVRHFVVVLIPWRRFKGIAGLGIPISFRSGWVVI